MDLHDARAVVEAHRCAVGAGTQATPDGLGWQRVEGLGDLGVLVAGDLRLAPERHVIGRGRDGEQRLELDRLEVFAGPALRAGVAAQAGLWWHHTTARTRACSSVARRSPAKQSSRT
jgi:hypothetical protein